MIPQWRRSCGQVASTASKPSSGDSQPALIDEPSTMPSPPTPNGGRKLRDDRSIRSGALPGRLLSDHPVQRAPRWDRRVEHHVPSTCGNYEGRLVWDARQLHALCDDGVDRWTKQHDVCLLLTHQGPNWLTPQARKHGEADIAWLDVSPRISSDTSTKQVSAVSVRVAARARHGSGKAARSLAWKTLVSRHKWSVRMVTRPDALNLALSKPFYGSGRASPPERPEDGGSYLTTPTPSWNPTREPPPILFPPRRRPRRAPLPDMRPEPPAPSLYVTKPAPVFRAM